MRLRSPTGLARRPAGETGIGSRLFALAFAALSLLAAGACGEIGNVESEGRTDAGAQADPADSAETSTLEEGAATGSSEFKDLEAGISHTCGLRTDGTVACWGRNSRGRADAPAGHFSAVTAGEEHSCGLRTDGTVECWGGNQHGQADAPAGHFSAVTAGRQHSCGLRTDGTVECWGAPSSWGGVPEGQFSAVTATDVNTCGLHTDGAITCWGPDRAGRNAPSEGQFSAVSSGRRHSCGLRTDGTITCWGAGPGQFAPKGQFSVVSSGDLHSCGLRTDGTATCWGVDFDGQARAPAGQFATIAAGGDHSCGLRPDGTVTCWGAAPDGLGAVKPTPPGVDLDDGSHLADPSMCRPRGAPVDHTAGFPLPLWAGRATGTLRTAVLFVDFPDAEAGHTTEQEADLGLPFMEAYIESSSYGKLDLEFVPLHQWLRAASSHEDYGAVSISGLRSTGVGVADEAIVLADPHLDFANVDAALLVLPSSHFRGGEGGSGRQFSTSEGTLGPVSFVNSRPVDASSTGNGEWGTTATHEFLHSLGLLDHYPYGAPRSHWPSQYEGMLIDFGAMGLRGLAPFDSGNQAISDRSAPGFEYREAPEMLAWSRWQLGWLDDTQIECVTGDEASVTLGPVADPGDHTAMVAVPLSHRHLIVVESRRSVGYDSGDALAHEGVLVYTVDAAVTVDANVGSGRLPIKLAGATGDTLHDYDILDDYPVHVAGESVTLHGYEIAVTADDGLTHTVNISRIPGE